MIIAELSIIPIGTKTTGVGNYIEAALKELKQQGGVRAQPEAMGTVIEAASLGDLFHAVEVAHNAVFGSGVQRVVTEIKIDDRRDKEATIESKTAALR